MTELGWKSLGVLELDGAAQHGREALGFPGFGRPMLCWSMAAMR